VASRMDPRYMTIYDENKIAIEGDTWRLTLRPSGISIGRCSEPLYYRNYS
jgi:hypothetical protein